MSIIRLNCTARYQCIMSREACLVAKQKTQYLSLSIKKSHLLNKKIFPIYFTWTVVIRNIFQLVVVIKYSAPNKLFLRIK